MKPPPRLHWTGCQASFSMERCSKNGFNVSWKLASAVIHDYVNFENRVSRKPTSRWIQDFILHTFCLQYISSRHTKAQVSIFYGVPVVTSWNWRIFENFRVTYIGIGDRRLFCQILKNGGSYIWRTKKGRDFSDRRFWRQSISPCSGKVEKSCILLLRCLMTVLRQYSSFLRNA